MSKFNNVTVIVLHDHAHEHSYRGKLKRCFEELKNLNFTVVDTNMKPITDIHDFRLHNTYDNLDNVETDIAIEPNHAVFEEENKTLDRPAQYRFTFNQVDANKAVVFKLAI